MPPEKTTQRVPIRELARYYLRLGLLGFGGPVALVGQMERELVGEKKAQQGRDARGNRCLPILAGSPCDPGRYLDLVHPWRLLGSVGWRVGVHPAELHHRGN